MSTRSTVHINGMTGEPQVIYTHHDGYPEARAKELLDFIDDCDDRGLPVTAETWIAYSYRIRGGGGNIATIETEDPGDIEYRYRFDDRSWGEPPTLYCDERVRLGDQWRTHTVTWGWLAPRRIPFLERHLRFADERGGVYALTAEERAEIEAEIVELQALVDGEAAKVMA